MSDGTKKDALEDYRERYLRTPYATILPGQTEPHISFEFWLASRCRHFEESYKTLALSLKPAFDLLEENMP